MIVDDDGWPNEEMKIEPSNKDGLFSRLPWWLIMGVAVVVTELTTHPAIGVSVLCLKFGWDDFRTAVWLRSRDPNRERGAVCSWFYISSGAWRVFLWSFALLSAACVVLRATQPPNVNVMPPLEVAVCLAVCLASFAVATLLTTIATGLAWQRGVKVWISGPVSQSCRWNEWPPRPLPGRLAPTNLLKCWLIGTSAGVFVLPFLVSLFSILVLAKFLLPVFVENNRQAVTLIAVGVGAGLSFIATVFVLVFGGRIFQQIDATSPADCWPDECLPVVAAPFD